ncbi:MAG: hypothetical protein IPM54_10925 [Polyangiaceae bacterium]|nr:hypothetical protein [Polyangiaceae bacterium]
MTGSAWADEPHEPIAPTALPEPPLPPPTLPLTPPTTQPPPPVQAPPPYPHYNVQAAGIQQPAPQVSWYGWQSLIGVVPTHLMAAGGLFGGGFWLLIPTVIGGVFTTPIVHGGKWEYGSYVSELRRQRFGAAGRLGHWKCRGFP